METRKAKIIRTRPGGTAGKNSCGYRISLPSSWIRKLGMDSDNTEIELQFDGETITIRQKQTAEQYLKAHQAEGHVIKKYSFYNFEVLPEIILSVSKADSEISQKTAAPMNPCSLSESWFMGVYYSLHCIFYKPDIRNKL